MQVREDKPLQKRNPLKVHMSWQKSKLRKPRLLLVIHLPVDTGPDFRKEQFKQESRFTPHDDSGNIIDTTVADY